MPKKSLFLSTGGLAVLLLLTFISVPAQGVAGSARDAWGPLYSPAVRNESVLHRVAPPQGENPLERLRYWNEIAINASGLDHTPVASGENRVFGEQLGPGRSSRAMAIVHIAIFDAVNSIAGGYRSYSGLRRMGVDASMDSAIAQAAHDALVSVFPSQRPGFDQLLAADLAQIPAGTRKNNGIDLGRRAAVAILTLRTDDGSQHAEPRINVDYIPISRPGYWRQDPISLVPLALGAHWGEVRPFALESTSQFRIPPPPDMTSPEYAAAYNEVKRIGGDGIVTPTERTAEQTEIGIYWAYDGTPSLCAPPRLYNQIAVQIATQRGSNVTELARLLALVNTAMADAGTSSWESKYFYCTWRPVRGIRESDPGPGRFSWGDGNPATVADPNFKPMGAPASNLSGPNFTPPFPSYPSGHATFGGALFQTLRDFYRTDNIPFTFVSDEFNGVTLDNQGNPRPLMPRTFASLSQAEEENGQSRIYLGIHWSFDKTEGIAQGRQVADYVFTHAFLPIR
ncbi:MAG: phosphatase PAP2 family protein [Acidobacteria bacterium]|nr:phosphatase PAP2 family protein [Acidobacteriota bacterium]